MSSRHVELDHLRAALHLIADREPELLLAVADPRRADRSDLPPPWRPVV